MKKFSLLLLVLLIAAICSAAQSSDQASADSAERANVQKARAALDAMVRAMGGPQWLALQNSYTEGRVSGFYQGKPTGAITDYRQWTTPAGEQRIEIGKKHDDVEIFTGDQCWEATYKGKKPLPKEICDDALRRKAHSIDVAIRQWLKDPNTILISEGQSLSERHLTDQVTLISPSNDSITIQMDTETHLPRSRTFQWRDPLYKDKNEEREEYDDYHTIDGIPTPFSVTRFHNGDVNSQRYLYRGSYNVPLPPDAFNVDAAAAKVQK
jgi:type II secretory pathway component PulJ